jgi:hypothetical protein
MKSVRAHSVRLLALHLAPAGCIWLWRSDVFVVHIPRTGGSSLETALLNTLRPANRAKHRLDKADLRQAMPQDCQKKNRTDPYDRDPGYCNTFHMSDGYARKIISDCYNRTGATRDFESVAILRDPLSTARSAWAYLREKRGYRRTFEDFITSRDFLRVDVSEIFAWPQHAFLVAGVTMLFAYSPTNAKIFDFLGHALRRNRSALDPAMHIMHFAVPESTVAPAAASGTAAAFNQSSRQEPDRVLGDQPGALRADGANRTHSITRLSKEAQQVLDDARATDWLLWEWLVACERRSAPRAACVTPAHLMPVAYGASTREFAWQLDGSRLCSHSPLVG